MKFLVIKSFIEYFLNLPLSSFSILILIIIQRNQKNYDLRNIHKSNLVNKISITNYLFPNLIKGLIILPMNFILFLIIIHLNHFIN